MKIALNNFIYIIAKFFPSMYNRLPARLKRFYDNFLLKQVEEISLVDAKFASGAWEILLKGFETQGYRKEEGEPFANTDEEINTLLKEQPYFKIFRPYIYNWVRRKREEVGLPL